MSMAMASSRRSRPFLVVPCFANAFSDHVANSHSADESRRLDSNQRPHGPEPCALAKLSYAPWFVYRNWPQKNVNGSDPKRAIRLTFLSSHEKMSNRSCRRARLRFFLTPWGVLALDSLGSAGYS